MDMRLRTLALGLALSCGVAGMAQAAAGRPKVQKSQKFKKTKIQKTQKYKQSKASKVKPRKAKKVKSAHR
jgi:hypothetical protein